MIFNKTPLEFLIELLSGLSDKIPIYKVFMDSDIDSVPDSYILIRTNMNSHPSLYGDGKPKVRTDIGYINLISKGKSNFTTSLHELNKCKIEDLLKLKGISYFSNDLGYDKETDTTEHSFSMEISFYG